MRAPMDRRHLHKSNGAKSTWEFTVKSLVRVTGWVFEVLFRHVTRTVSEKYQTLHCLRDKQWTEVLVTQSWRSFPSHQKFALCVTGSQREKLSTKIVSLLWSYSPLVEWRNILPRICILTPDHLIVTQHLQQVPTKIFVEDNTATDYNVRATFMRAFVFEGRY